MTDKEKILGRIRALQLKEKELPAVPAFPFDAGLKDEFKSALELAKATVIESQFDQIPELIKKQFHELKNIYSGVSGVPGNILPEMLADIMNLNELDLAVLQADFGVAENGAMWISKKDLEIPALPFICKYLVIVLEKSSLVSNMHEAYQRIQQPIESFGLFIAGPSKTADIEQSVVIGAHGPLGLTVFLTEKG
jgi:L-lactate dehydrogenase complex protein LldG